MTAVDGSRAPARGSPAWPDTTPGGVTLDRAKLLAARLRAASERPYLAAALYALCVVASPAVPTMGVDRRWRCYVNAAFVAETSVPELAGVWVHEVSHLLRDHHGRAERLPLEYHGDRQRINVAQDCEINDDLLRDGLILPAGRVEPADLGLAPGQLFETYVPDVPPSPRWQCGSGAHGAAQSWELGADQMVGVSDAEAQSIRRYTAAAIRDHQRSRGNTPAGWLRWADTVLEPVVDWRQVLAGSVRRAVAWAAGAVDYSYQRPGRRGGALPGVVLPTLRRPTPTVAIVVDTSGSMSGEALASALAEVTGVLRGIGVRRRRVTVLACDAAVAVTQHVTRAEEVELAGGGGTDLRVGIAAALALPIRPDVIVVLTDGETPWPDEPVPARLIAGLIGQQPPDPPDWIETFRMAG